MDKYPVLDESGKVKQWLAEGRGVDVWQSQEIGANWPDMLTPHGSPKPHWAYALHLDNADPEALVFYQPVHIVKSWRDTPQGVKAAKRALGTYPDETRVTPAGTFKRTYTLVYYTLGSIHIRPDAEGGTIVRYRAEGEEHPTLLAVEFRVGILMWLAQIA